MFQFFNRIGERFGRPEFLDQLVGQSIFFAIIFLIVYSILFIAIRKTKHSKWDLDQILHKTSRFIYSLLVFLFFTKILEILIPEAPTLISLKNILIISSIGIGLISLIKSLRKSLLRYAINERKDTHLYLVDLISKFAITVISIGTISGILQVMGVGAAAFVTLGGGAALFLLSNKDLFANVFGFFCIYWGNLFQINELIKIPDKNIEGKVEEIGVLFTSIRGLTFLKIYVPNSYFNTFVTENLSRSIGCVLEEQFELWHNNKISEAQINLIKLEEKLLKIEGLASFCMNPLVIKEHDDKKIVFNVKIILEEKSREICQMTLQQARNLIIETIRMTTWN